MVWVGVVSVFDQVLNEEDDPGYSLHRCDEQLRQCLSRALCSGLIRLYVCVCV